MDGEIDGRGGERLKGGKIDKTEITQLREKIMCTIIDKQFVSPA